MKCSQCGKPAIFAYEEFGPLCVDCNLKLQQSLDIQRGAQEKMINFLMDEMEATAGVHLGGGRFPDRRPIVHTGNVDYKPIVFSNSVVGNINQGTVTSLNANLQNINITNPAYADNIKNFIEASAKDKQLNSAQKNDIAQKLDFLAQQIQNQNKNKTIVQTIIDSVTKMVEVSANLATLWSVLSPIFLK